MKTTLVTVLSFVVASVAFAAEPSLKVVNGKENYIVKVIYSSEKSENVKVTIFNQTGEVVFTETIKGYNAFMLPVNFNGLPYGQYTVEVSGKSGKKSQIVDYVEAKSEQLAKKQVAPVKAVHVSKLSADAKYLLAVSNEGKKNINIRIFDGQNNLIHSESRTIDGSYGLVYNLEQIIGNPTFEVTDNSGSTQTVKK